METETTWSRFPNGGKGIVEQILVSDDINKSKRAGLWQSQTGIHVGMLTMSKIIWNAKKYISFHQVYQFHQKSWASPYDGC